MPDSQQRYSTMAGPMRGGITAGDIEAARERRDEANDNFHAADKRAHERKAELVKTAGGLERLNAAQVGELEDLYAAVGERGVRVDRTNDDIARLLGQAYGTRADGRSGVEVRALRPDQSLAEQVGGAGGLHLSGFLRGLLTGRWDGAEPERASMTIVPGASGGFLVPENLSAEVLDNARSMTRVIEAGARTVPLEEGTTHVAKIIGDPAANWRDEGQPIPEDATALGRVTFTPHTLAALVKTSRELFEDAVNLEEVVRLAVAGSIAVELDRVALRGSGIDAEPAGILNTPGVTILPLASSPTYDDLVAAAGVVVDANYTPTAQIMAPRTDRDLAVLKDSTGQYLRPPPTLDGVGRLPTTVVPTDLGVGADESEIYSGAWPQLFIGVRVGLQIQLLTERYADSGEFAFLVWFRGDVQVARPEAFVVHEQVLPAA